MNETRIETSRWVVGCSLMVLGFSASADAGYQETTQITGGALVDSLRAVPFMPKSMKQLLEPTVSSVALRGNQLARVSKASTEIIDLDQETITRIDHDRKTYTVTTFAEMRQAINEVPKKLEAAEAKAPAAGAPPAEQPQVTVSFDVSVTDTGVSRPINGVPSKEQIMTLKAHVTPVDKDPAQQRESVTYNVITDIWTAPEPPEMQAIDDFNLRFGKKLMQGVDTAKLQKSIQPIMDGSALAPLFASQPGMSAAMPDMLKRMATEMDKIKGVRILEITRMGGDGMVPPAPGTLPAATAGGGTGSTSGTSTATSAAVNQVTTETTAAAIQQQAGKLGAIGSAFGNSLLGAFHRNTPPPPAAAAPGAAADSQAAASVVLYEMTTQKSDFSQGPVPAAAFTVPAGYAKVDPQAQSPAKQGLRPS